MSNMKGAVSEVSVEQYRVRGFLGRTLLYGFLLLGAIIAIFPFFWMLETSFKTYGEHGARIFWPAGLTLAPYLGRPAAREVVLDMGPADGWSNVPRSFSPAIAGTLEVDQGHQITLLPKLKKRVNLYPLKSIFWLMIRPMMNVVNYNAYVLNVNSKVVKQFTTRITGNRNRRT